MNKKTMYTVLVESAFAKRKYAEHLLEEAEEDLVRAKKLLEEDNGAEDCKEE